eukprot:TRINITY_DN9879_c0_g1::TRINITY_DN9879_c0_g1_i1::g.2954::m.2954 TRINITY_DN9879_c0_g1::TRINITY_DN9879_c0_g1_i1::g.2954  ORF type:complete len:144 (-),score=-1.61,sp/O44437/SMD3_DROME/62.83/9e-44,LSM/PF01423.17/1.5e-12 TRINITY_DN9879_c0_g1_i1:198-602(-)
MSIGIPVKLVHEAEGHVITLELHTGQVYRGNLIEAEDNMNLMLSQVTRTERDGKVISLEHAFIRGSKIRFLILPDMLKNAPMFRRIDKKTGQAGRGLGIGRGRAVQMRHQAQKKTMPPGAPGGGRNPNQPPVRR